MNKEIVKEVTDGNATLIDVRTNLEWNAEHAVPAIHCNLRDLEQGNMPDLPTDTPIYTYCNAGGRAGRAKEILQAHGFQHVENVGGLSDWIIVGGKTVRA